MLWDSAHVDWCGATVKMRRRLPFTLKASTLPSPRSANVTVPAGGDARAVQPRPGPLATSNSPLVPGLLRSTNCSPFSPTAVARIRWAGPTESGAESDHAPAGRAPEAEQIGVAGRGGGYQCGAGGPRCVEPKDAGAARRPTRRPGSARSAARPPPSRANTPTCPGRRHPVPTMGVADGPKATASRPSTSHLDAAAPVGLPLPESGAQRSNDPLLART